MSQILSSLVIATVFGFGLSLSQMINPARVVGFLDVAGKWDATLLFVMAGALSVTVSTFPLILRRRQPALGGQFSMPVKIRIDPPLVCGAALFGVGWGLSGFCPGPALAGLASAVPGVMIFVVAMIAGQWLVSCFEHGS